MTVRQLLPGAPSSLLEVCNGAAYVRANMVTSIDGAATVDGRVGGLTGVQDQLVLLLLRELADVVLVGAGTIRAEGYGPLRARDPKARVARGQAPHPVLAIVTCSGDLDLRAWRGSGSRPLVVVPDGVERARGLEREAWVIRVQVSGNELNMTEVVADLRKQVGPRILTEGGPRLLATMLAADLVTELFLTVSPQTAGGTGLRIAEGELAQREFALASVLEGANELFLHYRRQQSRSGF